MIIITIHYIVINYFSKQFASKWWKSSEINFIFNSFHCFFVACYNLLFICLLFYFYLNNYFCNFAVCTFISLWIENLGFVLFCVIRDKEIVTVVDKLENLSRNVHCFGQVFTMFCEHFAGILINCTKNYNMLPGSTQTGYTSKLSQKKGLTFDRKVVKPIH